MTFQLFEISGGFYFDSFGNSVTSTAEIQQQGAGGELFISYSGSTSKLDEAY